MDSQLVRSRHPDLPAAAPAPPTSAAPAPALVPPRAAGPPAFDTGDWRRWLVALPLGAFLVGLLAFAFGGRRRSAR